MTLLPAPKQNKFAYFLALPIPPLAAASFLPLFIAETVISSHRYWQPTGPFPADFPLTRAVTLAISFSLFTLWTLGLCVSTALAWHHQLDVFYMSLGLVFQLFISCTMQTLILCFEH